MILTAVAVAAPWIRTLATPFTLARLADEHACIQAGEHITARRLAGGRGEPARHLDRGSVPR